MEKYCSYISYTCIEIILAINDDDSVINIYDIYRINHVLDIQKITNSDKSIIKIRMTLIISDTGVPETTGCLRFCFLGTRIRSAAP